MVNISHQFQSFVPVCIIQAIHDNNPPPPTEYTLEVHRSHVYTITISEGPLNILGRMVKLDLELFLVAEMCCDAVRATYLKRNIGTI